MKRAPLPPVVAAMYRLGHHVDARPLVPNLVGIRAVRARLDLDKDVDPFESLTDRFDDYVGLVFHDGIMWREFLFRGTTDPGKLALPGERGTAVMKPGQYVGAYMLGKHRGYPALVNWGVTAPAYWRVVDKDGKPELVGEGEEYIGLNIHRANRDGDNPPTLVGPFSAGCQVIQDHDDWEWFIEKVASLASYAAMAHDLDYLTYTLLYTTDITDPPEPQEAQ
jgi:hypothetical protein